MDGWVIKNDKGSFLVKSHLWRPGKSAAALFFSDKDIEDLRNKAQAEGVDTTTLIMLPARLEHGRVVSFRNGWAKSFEAGR